MNWQDYSLQAQRDLKSCHLLYQNNDYGNSAYLLQQGLEKYIKAYLFRYDLFIGSPWKLGHLPLPTVWEIFSQGVENKMEHSDKVTKELFRNMSALIEIIANFFDRISDKKDKRLKHGLWKHSLQMNLNSQEEGVLDNYKKQMEIELTPLISDVYKKFMDVLLQIKPSITSNPEKKKALEHLVNRVMGESLDDLLNQDKYEQRNLREIADKTPQFFNQLGLLIHEVVNLADSKDLFLQSDFMKSLLIGWLFSIKDELMITYPHEDMGRYPLLLEGASTRTIYEQKSQELHELIIKGITACDRVEQMLKL